MIMSASRRTDIPSCHAQWFMERVREGTVQVSNPMNPKQTRLLELSPEAVDCIVFWTKDPRPLLPFLDELDARGFRYYFQFTLTPYDRTIEPNLRPKREILRTFLALSARLGPERVCWRYDPVILNRDLDEAYHLSAFEKLCRVLSGRTKSCTISFVDYYQKLRRKYENGLLRTILPEEMKRIASGFVRAAVPHGIAVRACCEQIDLSSCGVLPASCIDLQLAEKCAGHTIQIPQDKNQRPLCNCAASIDIGSYDTCSHGCVYCYANKMNKR